MVSSMKKGLLSPSTMAFSKFLCLQMAQDLLRLCEHEGTKCFEEKECQIPTIGQHTDARSNTM